jgi:hypothetical protein
MTERTWEAIGRLVVIPSLGGVGSFRGKLVNLCGRLTQIPMNANGTSTKEYFEIIKFMEDSNPFTMLLGKPWIDRDQARRKEEEEVLEQKKQELKDFMTRRIAHLIEEQENRSKLFNTRDPDVKAARTLEDPHETKVPVSNNSYLGLESIQVCKLHEKRPSAARKNIVLRLPIEQASEITLSMA